MFEKNLIQIILSILFFQMVQSFREDVSHWVLIQFCPIVVAILDF